MSDAADLDPSQATAERVRDTMSANDAVLGLLGMRVEAIGPGRATLSMVVRNEMLNGFGICHGGLVTTLADSAFAYACNSRDRLTVAAGFTVELLAPSFAGDVLTATAAAASQGGRSGVYDIGVHNQRGELVALFRGRSHTLKDRPVVGGAPLPRRA